MPADFASAFEHAQSLHAAGHLAEAERAYRQLTTSERHREVVLAALADLYLQAGRPTQAVDTLVALTEEVPDSLYYYSRLGDVLHQLGQAEAAISHYKRLLDRRPDLAEAHYNLALLYKRDKRYLEAVEQYNEAVRLDIDQVEEVYSNLGVLYSELRQADKARQMYERALEVDATYVPALFNLAGLFEEAGERQRAIEIYHEILSIDPKHWDSLSRLAYLTKLTSADDELITQLRRAIQSTASDKPAREGLQFALGKALDDVGRYDEAFAAYSAANQIGRSRAARYDPVAAEQAFGELIKLFDTDWLENVETSCQSAPIFICGMFRSGSTLTEQILAAHPSVQAGGELDILPWLVGKRLAPYPKRLENISANELKQVADEYLSEVRALFPRAENVTDKRPDNFVHLALIRAMFPLAKIIYTRRDLRDNCLSVYFQHLGGNLHYATDLADIAHYYGQQERLMAHWKHSFAENIFTVNYDELVRTPEPILRELLNFLALPWDERCLDFHCAKTHVKTASIWQVRDPLHTNSSGRWQNYESCVSKIEALQSDMNQT